MFKLKVLWVCNIVLPEFSNEFDLKKSNLGGWIRGMWNELNKKDDLELAICCPIKDDYRMKDGILNGNKYYSFKFITTPDYSEAVEARFVEIIKDFNPDLIHIWGTEYVHTLEVVNAAKKTNLLDKVVINIQGLVSVYAEHFTEGLPFEIAQNEEILSAKNDFINKGKFEIEAFKKVKHCIGRTDWDKACTFLINNEINYHFCNEIIRDEFYEMAGSWRYENCEKHSIFVSQASYPIKGFHYLIKALPAVLKIFPDTKVYVAGALQKGAYGEYITKLIEENKLNNNIIFTGMLTPKEMQEHYLKANIFVSASEIENSPNSVCEALILGVPTISSFVGGVARLIEQNNSGFLYPKTATYMLAFYITEIFSNRKLADKFSKNATNNMLKTNSKDVNSNKCLEIYNTITAK